MLGGVRGLLRRRRRRAAILCAVVLLGATVTAVHTSVADDHMGHATTMCLAVMAAGGAAVAVLPGLGRLLLRPPTLVSATGLALPDLPSPARRYRARGDPSVLQVFRR
jgi:peptidoglycan/LPS O-acetylase OafA/YrhL